MTTRKEGIEKVRTLIKNIDFAMLVTENADGELHSRPMSTQKAEFDGDLWFFAETNSEKMDDIRKNPSVNASYSQDGKYVSVAGTASIVTDLKKKKELWREEYRFYFQDGPESPDVALIKVKAHSAQYWDTPSGVVGKAISLVKILLSGDEDAAGESAKIKLSNVKK